MAFCLIKLEVGGQKKIFLSYLNFQLSRAGSFTYNFLVKIALPRNAQFVFYLERGDQSEMGLSCGIIYRLIKRY